MAATKMHRLTLRGASDALPRISLRIPEELHADKSLRFVGGLRVPPPRCPCLKALCATAGVLASRLAHRQVQALVAPELCKTLTFSAESM